jgi:DNA-binding MarR family transcriptional regulator
MSARAAGRNRNDRGGLTARATDTASSSARTAPARATRAAPPSASATPARADALELFGRAFKGAIAAQRRMRGREAHRPGELSYAQYGLLFGLCDEEPKSARELAIAADVSPATVTEMLDTLTAAGLVERARSEVDKRIVLTSLTPRGKALIDERRARYEPLWKAALAQFSDDELRAAASVLDAVRGMFDELAEKDA